MPDRRCLSALWYAAAALGLALVSSPASAQNPLGPDAAACRAGAPGPAILVRLHGFREPTGDIRVQLHGDNPATWLERNQWMRRIELPVPASGQMAVCVAVPRGGRYALAIRHDIDGDGRMTANDGGGFSNNPRLSPTRLRPTFEDAAFTVAPQGVTTVDIVLNYRVGLTIRPVRPRG